MGGVIGLVCGCGLAAVLWSMSPATPHTRAASASSLRWQDLLIAAGMPGIGPSGLIGICVGVGLLAAVVALAVTQSLPIALCFGGIAAVAPRSVVKSRAARRRKRVEGLWPDAVDHLTSAIRAGLSLPDALSQLAERGPEGLREPFARFASDYRATGNFDGCLDRLKDRLADPVADRVIEALRVTREVGGTDLGGMLRSLAAFLRDDARARGELAARQSWTVNGARVAAGAPWLVLAFLCTQEQSLAAYRTLAGGVVLLFGAGCSVLSYRLMSRIGRLPSEPRVLR